MIKTHKYFFALITISILSYAMSTYAFKQSAFRFTFHNNTDGNIVTIKKLTDPEGSTLRDNIGPTDMKPGEMHKFFLIQNPQTNADRTHDGPLVIKMSWQLTVKNEAGKILCQSNILGWVKGHISFQNYTVDTKNWRYKVLSEQSSGVHNMCKFNSKHPEKLPKPYTKYRMQCYPLSISVAKDNSISITTADKDK